MNLENVLQYPYTFTLDVALIFLSALSLGYVALMIFSDKRVQGHPNMLIAYTCLFDSFNFANYLMRYITCGFQGVDQWFEELFVHTV